MDYYPNIWLTTVTLFLHEVMNGKQAPDEYLSLLTGEAAMSAIATADAATLSRNEGRKVKLAEILRSS